MAGISRAYKRRGNMVANTGAPVMCLDAGSRISYPGSGTTWTDLSGNANTGTLVNGPTFNSANSGSIVFDGVNDYASVTYAASLDTPTGATYSLWMKKTSSVAGEFLSRGIADRGIDSDNPRLYHYSSNTVYIDWNTLAGSDRYVNSVAYTELSFNNLVFVFSPGAPFLFYANGVQVAVQMSGGSSDATMKNTAHNIIIGGAVWTNRFFTGKISSVTLHNRALSAAEITTNFELTRGRYGI